MRKITQYALYMLGSLWLFLPMAFWIWSQYSAWKQRQSGLPVMTLILLDIDFHPVYLGYVLAGFAVLSFIGVGCLLFWFAYSIGRAQKPHP